MCFLLDSDKQSFRVDNVSKFIKIKSAIVKIQCFENYSEFWHIKQEYNLYLWSQHKVSSKTK